MKRDFHPVFVGSGIRMGMLKYDLDFSYAKIKI